MEHTKIFDSETLKGMLDILPVATALVERDRIVHVNSLFLKIAGLESTPAIDDEGLHRLLEKALPDLFKWLSDRLQPHRSDDIGHRFYGLCRGMLSCDLSSCKIPTEKGEMTLFVCTDSTQNPVLANLPFVAMAIDTEDPTHTIYLSSLIETWTGYPLRQFDDDPSFFVSLVHPEDKQRYFSALHDLGKGRSKELDITYRIVSKEGTYRWVRQIAASNSSLGVCTGGIDKYLFVLIDITVEKEAELALAEARERYRLFFERAPVGILCCDRHGVIIDCNDQLAGLVGASREEVLGFKALQTRSPLLRRFTRSVLRGKEISYEGRYRSAITGKEMDISALAFPLKDENGTILGGFALVMDMSERVVLEKKLLRERDFSRAIVNSAGIIVIILDETGQIIDVNETTCEILGLPRKVLKGTAIWDSLISKNGMTMFQDAFKLAMAEGKAGPVETQCQTLDGPNKLISWSLTSIGNLERNTENLIATGVDVTEQRKLEEQLREAQKMDAIGRLAGGVAHDFNNQLTAILGYCQLILMDTDPSEKIYQQVKTIKAAAKRAAETTNQLLAFSRRQALQPCEVSLNAVIREGVELFRRLIGEDIEVILDLSQQDSVVRVDPGQIQQVLLNLALNARDAMPDGGEIRITTGRKDLSGFHRDDAINLMPGSYAVLKFTDTGHGMGLEVLEKAFEPFFTTKPMGKGTGLGLAMVYGTVRQSKGHVTIDSEEGKGTTVTIYLPRLAMSDKKDEEGGMFSSLPTGTQKILLVEDEDLVRDTVKKFLEQLGYEVVPQPTAEDALEFLENDTTGPPDVLLTDVVLPAMNGKKLAKEAISRCPDLKVIFMSGYTADIIAKHGVIPEGIPFLNKPFSIKDLAHMIKMALATKNEGGGLCGRL